MPISFKAQHMPKTADVIYIARYNDRPGIRVTQHEPKRREMVHYRVSKI